MSDSPASLGHIPRNGIYRVKGRSSAASSGTAHSRKGLYRFTHHQQYRCPFPPPPGPAHEPNAGGTQTWEIKKKKRRMFPFSSKEQLRCTEAARRKRGAWEPASPTDLLAGLATCGPHNSPDLLATGLQDRVDTVPSTGTAPAPVHCQPSCLCPPGNSQ